ncbi:MAG: hypothetical protein GF416_05250 [Candidatus Altiarchaeales archaeon]|nr:hypothetical protein [Candidatus Altiarchaeales archaeon]MBD3416523.1 hypothetical protein [Candidatus Altiarchaeales archaeon]
MKPKIEDLRKKAYMLYGGLDGVERVNREVKKMGIEEDKLNKHQEKIVLNNIIKNVFIDHVGLERAKDLLVKEVTHVPGYHRSVQENKDRIHIFERSNFMKWFVRFMVLLLVGLVFLAARYAMSFNRTEFCGQKKDVDARDICFQTLALGQNNLTYCDQLSTLQKKYQCYGSIGIAVNNSDYCLMIPDNEIALMGIRDKCILCVAFTLKNDSKCMLFRSSIKQEDCKSQLERGYSLICGGTT